MPNSPEYQQALAIARSGRRYTYQLYLPHRGPQRDTLVPAGVVEGGTHHYVLFQNERTGSTRGADGLLLTWSPESIHMEEFLVEVRR